jgi:hypothetical protein
MHASLLFPSRPDSYSCTHGDGEADTPPSHPAQQTIGAIMNVKSFSIIAGLIAAISSSAAFAGDEYTRNQNLPRANVSSSVPFAAHRIAAVDELQRNQLPAAVVPSNLQRAQVVAEAIEARKLGLVAHGELAAPTPTPEQAEQIRVAGLNAVNHQVAAK